MDKLVVLLCLVGLVASGLIDGRLRQDIQVIQGQQHRDVQRLKAMTREELLCQKFLLEILQQVELPLQNHQLLEISTEGITNENLYIGPIDDDMSLMLKLIRTDKVLGRNSHCSMTNEKDLRQMLGLYRLLVRSRDCDTFKRLAVYARQNINPVLFVNAITLAVQDRVDTRNLIVPALHEILPRLFHDNDLISQVQNLKLSDISDNETSKRRNILDIIGLGQQTRLNSQSSDVNILDRSQLWKPWQQMHRRLALQNILGRQATLRDQDKQHVIVLTSSKGIGRDNGQISLVANDVGLRSFLNVLVDELILTQGIVRNSNEGNQILQRSGIRDNILQNRLSEGILNNRDRLLNLNHRQNNQNEEDIRGERIVTDQHKWRGDDIDQQLNNRMNQNIRGSEDDWLNSRSVNDNQRERQQLNRELPTTSINSGRLLHINSRVLNKLRGNEQNDNLDNTAINRGGSQNRLNEMDSNVMRRTNINDQQRLADLGLRGHSNWQDIIMNRGGVETRSSQINSNSLGRNNIDDQGRIVGWGLRGHSNSGEQNDNLEESNINQLRGSQLNSNDDDDQERLIGLGIRGRQNSQQNDNIDDVEMKQVGSQMRGNSRMQILGQDSNVMGKNNIDNQGRVVGWGMRGSQQNDGNQIHRSQMNSNLMGRNTNDDDEDRLMGLGIRGRQISQRNDDLDNIEMNQGGARWQNLGQDSNVMGRNNIDDQGRVIGWGLRGHRNSGQQNEDLDDSILNQGRSQIRNTWENLGQNSNIRQKKSIDDREGLSGLGMGIENNMDRTLLSDDDARISTGHLLLQQLQQLVARLNIEDISLRRTDNLLDMPRNIGQQLSNRIVNPLLDNIGIDEHQRQVVLNKINEITDRLERVLQTATSHLSNLLHIDVRGSRVSQQLDHVLLTEILNEVLSLSDYVRDGQVSSILENPTTRILLRHIVNTVDRQLLKLQKGRNNQEILLNTVKINDVHIDKLQTYVEYADVDLSNMMESNILGDNGKNIHTVIGRIPRLNHKPFAMNVDITSDRNQQVVVRVLLVPQGEALGNVHSMENQRQNVVLLDIAQIDLKVGRNQINCQSRDVSWTGRDSTLYTDIYKRVLGALNGDINSLQDTVNVRNDLLPHRLLVPRGRVDGLPMQLVVVVTPAEQNVRGVQQQLQRTGRLGMDSLILDNLPLIYPLDKDINDINTLNSLPNIHMKPILIYHNDQI